MIDRDHALSVTKQAEAVGMARSTVYYLPRPVSAENLALMKQIDLLHMEFPFAGSRMLRQLLAAKGSKVGRRHVKTLMQRMGVAALYRRPCTTKPAPSALPLQNCSRIMTVASLELLPLRERGGGRDEAGQHGDEGRAACSGERAVQGE
jgi:hypothetical protein